MHGSPSLDVPDLNESIFADALDQLRARGVAVVRGLFSQPLLHGIRDEVVATDTQQFELAGIGRGRDLHLNQQVRTDRVLWLEGQSPWARAYLAVMEDLRINLNRSLLLGLQDYECHWAYYPAGGFYRRHLDAFRGQSNRRLSTVLYLNPEWQVGDGGQLAIYEGSGEQPLLTVDPQFGTLVMFLSEQFPHEVLPTRRARYSVTGWFRVDRGWLPPL